MEEPEEYVVTVLFLLPNIFGFAMKAASSAVAGPNHPIAKSATSAVLAILTASSRFGQIGELYADIRQMAVGQIAILRRSYVSSKPRVRAEGLARVRKAICSNTHTRVDRVGLRGARRMPPSWRKGTAEDAFTQLAAVWRI
jgi:Mrp family chromosome partitioning ATPase